MSPLYDKTLSGYDNLFLVGGFDWTAKVFNKTQNINFIEIGLNYAKAFDNLPHKDDDIACIEWENSFRLICGIECLEVPTREIKQVSIEEIKESTSSLETSITDIKELPKKKKSSRK